MNHDYIKQGEEAVNEQIAGVPHQSDAYRALDESIRNAAGWDSEKAAWKNREPNALKIRIKATGTVIEIGFQHGRDRVLAGVAELVEE